MKNILTFKMFLNEMAKPSLTHTKTLWFHGTSKENIDSIIKDGTIKPSKSVNKRTRRLMAPVYDKVYFTASVEEAVSYAYFRSSIDDPVYLIVIDGKSLKDVQPDEDIIADILQTENTVKGFEWLDRLAKYIDPKLYAKFQSMGDYAYSVSLAKKVVKQLNDTQKIELINKGMKIAHSGEIKIAEVWELPATNMPGRSYRHKINSTNYKEIGKKIF